MANIGDLVKVKIGNNLHSGVVVSKPSNGTTHVVGLYNHSNIPAIKRQWNDDALSSKPKGIAKIAKVYGLDPENKIFLTVPQVSSDIKITDILGKRIHAPLTYANMRVGQQIRCTYPNSPNYNRLAEVTKVGSSSFQVKWLEGLNRDEGTKWTLPSNFELADHWSDARQKDFIKIASRASLETATTTRTEVAPAENYAEIESKDDEEVYNEADADLPSEDDVKHAFSLSSLKFNDMVNITITDFDEESAENKNLNVEGTFLYKSGSVSLFVVKEDISTSEVQSATMESVMTDRLREDVGLVKFLKEKKLPKNLKILEVFDMDDSCIVNKKLSKKGELGMSADKNNFMAMVKKDAVDAGYRVASTQLTNAVKTGLLTMFKDKGMEDGKLGMMREFLETEFGAAIISAALGYGLTYAPTISEDERVKRLASEFRVNGMAIVGNEVIGVAMNYLMPAVTKALASLPAVEAEKASSEQTEVEEEHEEAPAKTATV